MSLLSLKTPQKNVQGSKVTAQTSLADYLAAENPKTAFVTKLAS